MLHDILFALNGTGGETLMNLCGCLHRDSALPHLLSMHPCEETIIEQLVNIAENYKSLQNFIKKVPQFGEEQIELDDGSRILPGMYLRAFCNGLYDSLKPYQLCLIKLEEEILENPDFSMLGILAQVCSFLPFFTTLNSIIKQIVLRELHGCKILQIVHENLSSGIEMVDEAMARIMQRCHLVMLKQLTSWLLYGHLIDPYEEFFITSQEIHQENLHSSMTTLDTESLAETVTNDTCILEYKVVPDFVPSYIPLSIPEKARFIGSTIVLFSSDPRDKKTGPDKKIQDPVFKKMETSLLAQLKLLQKSVIDISFLESVVDNARSCVIQHLFSLAKDKANLLGELKSIKELFLLGRGELFVTFLRKANNTLFKPISSNSGRDLSNLLYSAARYVQLNSDGIMERFSFRVPPKDSVPVGTTVWSVMSLEYSPPWPLHQLFTPAVLSSYNTLFNFLLQVKIAELNLHDVWTDNIKKKNQLSGNVWTLRNWLMFLIHNLQCYLHQDVLESEYSILQAALDKTQDFEQVIHEHSVFLSHIMSQTFLLSREVHAPNQPVSIKRHPVNKVLIKIMKLCDTFCSEVSKSEISEDNLKTISGDLEQNIFVLMKLITVLGNKATGLQLLLLRLDYNRFFSARSCN